MTDKHQCTWQWWHSTIAGCWILCLSVLLYAIFKCLYLFNCILFVSLITYLSISYLQFHLDIHIIYLHICIVIGLYTFLAGYQFIYTSVHIHVYQFIWLYIDASLSIELYLKRWIVRLYLYFYTFISTS